MIDCILLKVLFQGHYEGGFNFIRQAVEWITLLTCPVSSRPFMDVFHSPVCKMY